MKEARIAALEGHKKTEKKPMEKKAEARKIEGKKAEERKPIPAGQLKNLEEEFLKSEDEGESTSTSVIEDTEDSNENMKAKKNEVEDMETE